MFWFFVFFFFVYKGWKCGEVLSWFVEQEVCRNHQRDMEKKEIKESKELCCLAITLCEISLKCLLLFSPTHQFFPPPMSLQRLSHFQVSESESVEMLHFKTCITWAQMWLWTLKNGIKLWWTNSWINTKIEGASWQHPAAETPLLLTHTQKRREWVRGNAETLWQEWEAHPCPH